MDKNSQLSQVDKDNAETSSMADGVAHSTQITTAVTRATESTARRHDAVVVVIEEVSEETEITLTSQTQPASDVGDMRRLLPKSMRGTFTAKNFSARGILDHATPMPKKDHLTVPKPTWHRTSTTSATSVAATKDVAASSRQLQEAVDVSTICEITPAVGLVEDRQEADSAAEILTQSMAAVGLAEDRQAVSAAEILTQSMPSAPSHRVSREQMQRFLEVVNEPTTETEMERNAIIEAIDHFYGKLLDYIVQDSRILLCHNVNTWHKFDKKNCLLNERELTSAKVRDIFVKVMLPNIYEIIQAQPQYAQKLNLLKYHPHLQRTPTGYIFKSAITNIKPLTFNVDYRLLKSINIDEELDKLVKADHIDGVESDTSDEEAAAQPRKKFKFETQKSKPLMSNFFVAMGAAGKPELARPQQKKFCASTHALLSAVVSKPFETHNLLLIDPAEILQRLQRAKSQFLKDGQQTVCTNAAELERSLSNSMRTRDSILNIMNRRF